MKNIEQIKSLIEQLKQEIENEYELKRINLIERDLIQGLPEVEIIDDCTQKFNGRIYKLNQNGHFGSIHRDVWIYYNATVPGNEYDVHHVDFDKSNNDISNLQLLTRSEHRKIHNPKHCRRGQPLEKEFICDVCGKKYLAFDVGQKIHYCSKHCLEKSKHLRLQKSIKCQNCGKEFAVRKYDKKTKFCSKQCASEYSHKQAVEQKKCPVCGKVFECYKYRRQECCSPECGNKWRSIKRLVTCICEKCGKEFKKSPRRQKILCDECIEEQRREGRNRSTKLKERYQQAHEKRICPVCGKEFDSVKSARKECCSRRCRSRLRSMKEAAQALKQIKKKIKQKQEQCESIQLSLW